MPQTQPQVVLRHAVSGKWLCLTSPYRTLTAWRTEEVIPLIREVDEASERDGVYAAGFVSYEAATAFDPTLPSKDDPTFPLCWFGLFRQVSETQRLPDSPKGNCPLVWQPSLTPKQYRHCHHVIRKYIRNGDTYQVDFTYRLWATGQADAWKFFLQTMSTQAAPYAAFVDIGEWAICSASPELFFRLDGNQIESRPMKGTAARGLWYEDDQRRAIELRCSEKERAENVMIVDMVRNDLGRIAMCGTVQVPCLFSVEKYPTVWQMTSTVRGRTRSPLAQIFAALFPPASVTGAPKRRTMEIIAELETSPRRIYTGAIGFVGPARRAQFNVAIRTVLMHKPSCRLEYGVGGGIVWDSRPASEFEECSVKARILHPRRQDFELLETILWSPEEGYSLLEYHLKRIAQSANYFAFDVNVCRIRERLAEMAARLPPVPHRTRVVIARNGASRCEASQLEPALMRFEDIPLAKSPVDSSDVFLYHKTTYRRVYEDAVRLTQGSKDVLLFNEAGQITESTVANVAFEIDGVWCTPSLHCGLVPGTYRAWLLDRRQIQEKVVSIDEALRSPNIFLMNSIRGMHKVRIVSSQEYASPNQRMQATACSRV